MAHPVTPGTADPAVGPWERKRVLATLEIERAGLELLALRGLDQVTIEEVADAAGVSVRTFFRYFRNVPDLLTGVPERDADRIGRSVAARPAGERLADCLRAALVPIEETSATGDNPDLEKRNSVLWRAVVRTDPERVGALSQGLTIMVTALTDAVAARQPDPAADDAGATILGAALGGLVWSVYLRSIRLGAALAPLLDEALARLGQLF